MAETAKKTDPKLWEKVKKDVTQSAKGGKPGQWSARKAQMATQEYKSQGGGYSGKKSADNHLTQWTDEKWGTKSGAKSEDSGERYLPEKARKSLSAEEYARSSAKKRADTAKGKQFSKQPRAIARKAAAARTGAKGTGGGSTKADLMAQARSAKIAGRSRMSKAQLQAALARH